MTILTQIPPTNTPPKAPYYIPTRAEFAHVNLYGEFGAYDPSAKRAIFQTPYRAETFARTYPDLLDDGWEIGYMTPGRSVIMTVGWTGGEVTSGQVTIEDTDGRVRSYSLTKRSYNRLRRLWQKSPMGRRDLTQLGKAGAVYSFRW